jgi:hypothetical protein
MKTLIRPVSRLLVAAALAVGLATASASEQQYDTPFGVLTVDVDPNWSEVAEMPDGMRGIGFETGGGRDMQWLLGTIEDLPDGSADAGTLRMLANDLRRSDAGGGLRVSDDVLALSGPDFRGYYYRATNPASVPAPGDYKEMYVGFIAVGSTPLMFMISWNSGGKPAADRALAALGRLRIVTR